MAQIYYRVTAGDWLFNRHGFAIYEPDEHRIYRVKANLSYRHATNEFDVTYHTDRYGRRSDSTHGFVLPAKDPDAYRILFLGPSFTFGWAGNFEDIYVTRIADKLSIKNKRIEVINLGTPAQPPTLQLCWVKERGAEYQPDMVVQTVYGTAGMIDSECRKADKPIFVKDGNLFASKPTVLESVRGKSRESAIVFYSWYAYQFLKTPNSGSTGMGTEFYDNTNDNESKLAAPDFGSLYENYVDTVRKHLGLNTEIAFIYVPYSHIVRPEDVSRWPHATQLHPNALRDEAAFVTASLNDLSINFINPLDALVERDRRERTYHFLDIHFTAAGNEVVAAFAAPVIQKLIDNQLDN